MTNTIPIPAMAEPVITAIPIEPIQPIDLDYIPGVHRTESKEMRRYFAAKKQYLLDKETFVRSTFSDISRNLLLRSEESFQATLPDVFLSQESPHYQILRVIQDPVYKLFSHLNPDVTGDYNSGMFSYSELRSHMETVDWVDDLPEILADLAHRGWMWEVPSGYGCGDESWVLVVSFHAQVESLKDAVAQKTRIEDRTQSHVVYRFYDRNDALLYVGRTANIGSRFTQHQIDKDWFKSVSTITLDHCDSKTEAIQLEADLIATEQPHFNIMLKR